jgi:hypothetical protein
LFGQPIFKDIKVQIENEVSFKRHGEEDNIWSKTNAGLSSAAVLVVLVAAKSITGTISGTLVDPNGAQINPTFGQINGARSARVIQLSLRLQF